MGQLLRIIIVLIGLWLVLLIIKRVLASRRKPPPTPATLDNMIACDHCGVHIPESEALHDGKQRYCCEEHRTAAKKP